MGRLPRGLRYEAVRASWRAGKRPLLPADGLDEVPQEDREQTQA
ncbi:hypothetical protein ACIRD8_32070 [Streptomyces sp. NPDC102451]